jgi:3-oxoacyl-[acyl-carrier-protein] synthase-3
MIIETFFPRKRLTNIDLETLFPDWSAAKIEEKVGIKERFIVEENETALDLAFEASNKALRSFDKSKIDFVLLCTKVLIICYQLAPAFCKIAWFRTNIGAPILI